MAPGARWTVYDAKRPGAVLSLRSKMRYTMENAGVNGETMAWVKLSGLADGTNGVDMMASLASIALLVVWWLRWRRWRRWCCGWFGGVDGVDGFDGLASIVDGELGSSTQRALTWKSLCVPSGEFGMHRGSLLSV